MVTVVILAGGNGSRVGADRPKQFIEINGKPIIAYTIEIFEKNEMIDSIEVVCHSEWKDYLDRMIFENGYKKIKWIVDGGNSFQESVICGINNLKGKISLDDCVLLQYAAAPLTLQNTVSSVIDKTKKSGSAVAAIPCYQLLGTKNGEKSLEWVDRDNYVQIACPQGFIFKYLLSIYERAKEQNILETTEPHTTSLMYELGDPLNLVYDSQTNIKITTVEDLKLFERIIF